MTDHTPGPWGASGVHVRTETHTVAVAVGQTRKAPWDGPDASVDYDQCCANARLIAAAPDLLEALEEVLEDITHEDHVPGDWSVQVVVRKAREAIAKAKGEQE